VNETMALFLASKMLAEKWRESLAGEPVERERRTRRRTAARWRGWLRAGRIATLLGLAPRGRPLRPAPARGAECCNPGCGA